MFSAWSVSWKKQIFSTYVDKIYRYKGLAMANDQSIDKAQRKLISVVYRFFDLMNKLSSTMTAVKLPIKKDMENHRLQNNYQKSLRKVKLILISVDSIFGTDLTDIQLISKCNKVSDFCCVLIFTVNTVGEFHGKIMNVKQLHKHPKVD